MKLSPEIIEKIENVKHLIFDVDGVLTDGSIIYTDSGEEIKVFNVTDGLGIKLCQKAGIEVTIITARNSKVVKVRADNLGITSLYQGNLNKMDAYEDLKKKTGLSDANFAYIGDDIIDLPVLNRVGFTAAPGTAVREVLEKVDFVTKKGGGRGAVREFCELILKSQQKWDEVTEVYNK